MQVILLEKLTNLGNLGDVVRVKDGFARNFLIPQRMARRATATAIAEFEAKRAELEAKQHSILAEAQKLADLIAGKDFVISAVASEEGKLFGSVGTRDIADAITEAGVKVSKAEVKLPTGTLRETGEYEIDVQLHAEVTATVKIVVIAEA